MTEFRRHFSPRGGVIERRYATVLYRVRYLWPHVRRSEAAAWLLGTKWPLSALR